MTLQELIKYLESHDPNITVANGFHDPHSYRGDYCDLAFEPRKNTTVGEMLKCAREALGSTYQGYKGGDFKMAEYTDCYLANYGECGDPITFLMLDHMIINAATMREAADGFECRPATEHDPECDIFTWFREQRKEGVEASPRPPCTCPIVKRLRAAAGEA